MTFSRSFSCYPCKFAGSGENRLVRCLHPSANTSEFKAHLKVNAVSTGRAFDFPNSFDSLALDHCDGFQRMGVRA